MKNTQETKQPNPPHSGIIVARDPKTGQFLPGHVKIGGRTEGQRNFETVFWEAVYSIAEFDKKKPLEIEERIMRKGIDMALKGHFPFWQHIIERLYGNTGIPGDITNNIVNNIQLIALADRYEEQLKKQLNAGTVQNINPQLHSGVPAENGERQAD